MRAVILYSRIPVCRKMRGLSAFSIFISLLSLIGLSIHYVQSQRSLRHPLHEFASKYNKGVWLGTTPTFNSLVKHVEEQAEVIAVQNCSLMYENMLSAMETNYMSTVFIEKHPDYKSLRFSFLATYFEHDFPNATKLSHAEYAHQLFDFMKRKDLVGGEWRRACWVIFVKWIVHSDEWRNATADNPNFAQFVKQLKTAQVDGMTIEDFVDCLMQIWSSASNFIKTGHKVEFPRIYQWVVFSFFQIGLPDETASLCTTMLVEFKGVPGTFPKSD